MKKLLLTLGKFFVFCCIVYFALMFLFASYAPRELGGNVFKYNRSYDYAFSRLKEADTTKNIDVLIIGSSHAYRGYDVRLFQEKGLRAFNLGTSAQTLPYTKYLLQKYVDKMKPKIVIVDIYPIILNSGGEESLLQLLSISKPDRGLIDGAIEGLNARVFNTLTYYSLRNALGMYGRGMKDLPSKENKYIKGGFVENFSVGKIYKSGNATLKFSKEQKKAMADIAAMLKKRNIKYYLFQSPIHPLKYSAILNIKQIDAQLSTFGSYYNFNAEQTLPGSCFLDDNHLNTNGAKIYDEYVINKILNN